MLGPKRSRSRRPTRKRRFWGWEEEEEEEEEVVGEGVCVWRPNAAATAMLTAMVDFPTPPLAEEIRSVLVTWGTRRFCGRPRCIRGSGGGEPVRGRPWGY